MRVCRSYRELSGVDKAALLLLSMGEEQTARMMEILDDDEVQDISRAMTQLGTVSADVVSELFADFSNQVSGVGGVNGTVDTTERFLIRTVGPEKAAAIMDEIRGPSGRTVWQKMSRLSPPVIATYLRQEAPQTIAVVLSRVAADTAAGVLMAFPETLAQEVIQRMLVMEAPRKEIVAELERTLRLEFTGHLSRYSSEDRYTAIAQIFASMDGRAEERFLLRLSERSPDAAEKVRKRMFTFEDLKDLDRSGVQTLMAQIDRTRLPIALKGADHTLRQLFLDGMSSRAARMLEEDIAALGPVRLSDVRGAQDEIAGIAKAMSENGQLVLGREQMVA